MKLEEAFSIVLCLAEENALDEIAMDGEEELAKQKKRQAQAIRLVTKVAVEIQRAGKYVDARMRGKTLLAALFLSVVVASSASAQSIGPRYDPNAVQRYQQEQQQQQRQQEELNIQRRQEQLLRDNNNLLQQQRLDDQMRDMRQQQDQQNQWWGGR